jgi:protein-S-isoprenylcysteine O-methyltransferase Ste14
LPPGGVLYNHRVDAEAVIMGNPIVRGIVVMVSTVGWLALAVAGWGSIGKFFAHEALVALVVIQLLVAFASIFVGGNLSAGVKEDRGNRWVLWAFGALGLLLGWLPAWTDRHDVWSLDHQTIRWVGVAVFTAGCWLRLWPVYVLGHRFSGLVAIQANHTLVTDGIYRTVRNPSYLGALVISLGWSLAFRSIAGIGLTVLLLLTLIGRMNAEERLLQEQFGAEYDAYRARTWRLLPGIY